MSRAAHVSATWVADTDGTLRSGPSFGGAVEGDGRPRTGAGLAFSWRRSAGLLLAPAPGWSVRALRFVPFLTLAACPVADDDPGDDDSAPDTDTDVCACDLGAPGATDFDSRTFQGSCTLLDVKCYEFDANPVACTLSGGEPTFLGCVLATYCEGLGGVWTPSENCPWTYCPLEGEYATTWTARTYLADPTTCPSANP